MLIRLVILLAALMGVGTGLALEVDRAVLPRLTVGGRHAGSQEGQRRQRCGR
jgi:hypothetical protein